MFNVSCTEIKELEVPWWNLKEQALTQTKAKHLSLHPLAHSAVGVWSLLPQHVVNMRNM